MWDPWCNRMNVILYYTVKWSATLSERVFLTGFLSLCLVLSRLGSGVIDTYKSLKTWHAIAAVGVTVGGFMNWYPIWEADIDMYTYLILL